MCFYFKRKFDLWHVSDGKVATSIDTELMDCCCVNTLDTFLIIVGKTRANILIIYTYRSINGVYE